MTDTTPKQAKPLTDDVLAAIAATAMRPRTGRGGRLESVEYARARGIFDIALCYTMTDAGLRRAEASALLWGDLEIQGDGSGRVTIRRGKWQPDPRTVYVSSVSVEWLRLLAALRPGFVPEDSIFGLCPDRISQRICGACRAAGFGDGYSGHSPRVGMAVRLDRAGAPTHTIMDQGRWKSGQGVSIYTRNEAPFDAGVWLEGQKLSTTPDENDTSRAFNSGQIGAYPQDRDNLSRVASTENERRSRMAKQLTISLTDSEAERLDMMVVRIQNEAEPADLARGEPVTMAALVRKALLAYIDFWERMHAGELDDCPSAQVILHSVDGIDYLS